MRKKCNAVRVSKLGESGAYRVGVLGVLALSAGCAWGQEAFDVNRVRTGSAPGADRQVEQRADEPYESGVVAADDVPVYNVSRFLIEYRSEHPEHPAIEGVMGAPVTLGVVPEGFVGAASGAPLTTIRLSDVVESTATKFSAAALTDVAKGVVKELNRGGLASVAVQIHPDDIDPETGDDKRSGQQGDLRLVVWTGRIAMVRSVAGGERLAGAIEAGKTTRVDSDDRVHARIRAQSPVQAGGLMNAREVDDYLFRLNRQPGRRVDASVAPGAAEEEIVLDYLVTESKPWSLYAQLSNTGTEQTSEWRQRVGAVHNNLTGSDDILRADFITASLQESQSLSLSYEFPIRSDELRMRIYGGYSEFEASDVGVAGERFSGQTYYVGAEVAWNVYQYRQLFIDLVGGLRYQSVKVDNEIFQEFGRERFLIPYVGARVERVSDVATTFGSLILEYQNPDLADVDANEVQQLGRTGVDDEWQVLKFDFAQTYFVEPLVSDVFWGKGPSGPTTLAHEVALSVRGQYAFNNRLIPNEQDIAGGMFSVRGYPESVAAGDTVVVGTAEYRFHLPRWLPRSTPGTWSNGRAGWWRDMLGEDFRYVPNEAFGRTDWDLIFKAFVDVGATEISQARVGENSQTLVGAGLGIEYQFKRFVTARLDWGVALNDVDDPANGVQSGDNRVHVLVTVVY
jgi:hemolysin activation/secretion protein